MRFLVLVLVFASGLAIGCSRGRSGSMGDPGPALRLAIITDLKGYLEPCGCTSRPLGGIDRMAARIRTLRGGSTPLLVLMAGDLFFDTDSVEPSRADQATRNAETLRGILNGLNVAAALPGRYDRGQPAETLARLEAESTFPWIAMKGSVEVVRVDAGGLAIAVVGARPRADRQEVIAAIEEAAGATDLTIALSYGSRRDANRLAMIDGVDFVVQGGLDQDSPLAPHSAGTGWVLHAGRQGQGLTVVDVFRSSNGPYEDHSVWSRKERALQLDARIEELAQKIADWERLGSVDPADLATQQARLAALEADRRAVDVAPANSNRNAFSAEWIELPKDAPTDGAVTELMKAHNKVVNEANRKAFADLKPMPLGPGDIAYVGSQACETCHQPAYAWWRSHPHGRAYRTLENDNKEYNLDCVGCHVTGYDRPGGSTVTHNLDGALVDVGCESCHGPGGRHIRNPTVPLVVDPPESDCVGCHNEEHSDRFDYEVYKRMLIAPGHGLPPSAQGGALAPGTTHDGGRGGEH